MKGETKVKRIMQALGKCHPSNCPTNKQCWIVTIVLAIGVTGIVLWIIF